MELLCVTSVPAPYQLFPPAPPLTQEVYSSPGSTAHGPMPPSVVTCHSVPSIFLPMMTVPLAFALYCQHKVQEVMPGCVPLVALLTPDVDEIDTASIKDS
eukprot:1121887-Rhodomonas_salina.1